MIPATLSAPSPNRVELLALGFVLFFVAYVVLYEIGLKCLRHWWATRKPVRLGREESQERAARAALRPPRDIEVGPR